MDNKNYLKLLLVQWQLHLGVSCAKTWKGHSRWWAQSIENGLHWYVCSVACALPSPMLICCFFLLGYQLLQSPQVSNASSTVSYWSYKYRQIWNNYFSIPKTFSNIGKVYNVMRLVTLLNIKRRISKDVIWFKAMVLIVDEGELYTGRLSDC